MRLHKMQELLEQLTGGGTGGGGTASESPETPHIVGNTQAGEPPFINSFTQSGSDPVTFYKDRGRVYLTGRIHATDPTSGTPAFVLPEGYRPPALFWFAPIVKDVDTGAVLTEVTAYVLPSGDLQLSDSTGNTSGDTMVILDGVNFPI